MLKVFTADVVRAYTNDFLDAVGDQTGWWREFEAPHCVPGDYIEYTLADNRRYVVKVTRIGKGSALNHEKYVEWHNWWVIEHEVIPSTELPIEGSYYCGPLTAEGKE